MHRQVARPAAIRNHPRHDKHRRRDGEPATDHRQRGQIGAQSLDPDGACRMNEGSGTYSQDTQGTDTFESESSMQATVRTAPPEAEQVSMSMLNTRFKRCSQVIEARRSAAVGSSASAAATASPPLPRPAGVTRARYPLLPLCSQPPAS